MSESRVLIDRMLPRPQRNWDGRAAANFICGGAGGGLLLATALASGRGDDLRPLVVVALGLVGVGLLAVWLEIGRPRRALHVYFNASTSWMTREAMVAPLLFVSGAAAVLFDGRAAFSIAGLLGLAYVYCQARLLQANKGIPAWRHASCALMIVATDITEGVGLLCVAALVWPKLATSGVGLAVLLVVRFLAWRHYRRSLSGAGVPVGTTAVFDEIDDRFVRLGHFVPAILGLAAGGAEFPLFVALAGGIAAASGAAFKYTLVRRAAFTQGFALPRTPMRGQGGAGPGARPGWNRAQPQ